MNTRINEKPKDLDFNKETVGEMDGRSEAQVQAQAQGETDSQPKGILSASFGLTTEFIRFIYSVGMTETIKILNYFLSLLKSQLENLIPSEQDQKDAIETNASLLQAIETIVENPEFQQKWRDFSEKIAQLLKVLLTKVLDTTETEVKQIMEAFVDLAQKNTEALVNGVGMGIMEGICVLPPVAPFCELAVVVGTGSKLTGKTVLTALETTSKLSEAFSKILGDSAQPIVETIQSIQDFIQYVKTMKENVSNTVVGTMDTLQNTLQGMQGDGAGAGADAINEPYSDISQTGGGADADADNVVIGQENGNKDRIKKNKDKHFSSLSRTTSKKQREKYSKRKTLKKR